MNDELYQQMLNKIDMEINHLNRAQDALKEACKHSEKADQQVVDAMKLIAGRLIDLELIRTQWVKEWHLVSDLQIKMSSPYVIKRGGEEISFPSGEFPEN